MDWNFKDLDNNLVEIAKGIPFILEGMKVIIANDTKATHRKRLDNGEPRKKYKSKAYEKFRSTQYGQNTNYINMQLSGEFVRSLTVGKEGKDIVYGVVNRGYGKGKADTSKVYRGQIERNGHGDLVKVNKDDTTRGIEAANRFFTDKIRELFDKV